MDINLTVFASVVLKVLKVNPTQQTEPEINIRENNEIRFEFTSEGKDYELEGRRFKVFKWDFKEEKETFEYYYKVIAWDCSQEGRLKGQRRSFEIPCSKIK